MRTRVWVGCVALLVGIACTQATKDQSDPPERAMKDTPSPEAPSPTAPTARSAELPPGWTGYQADGFTIGLPSQWAYMPGSEDGGFFDLAMLYSKAGEAGTPLFGLSAASYPATRAGAAELAAGEIIPLGQGAKRTSQEVIDLPTGPAQIEVYELPGRDEVWTYIAIPAEPHGVLLEFGARAKPGGPLDFEKIAATVRPGATLTSPTPFVPPSAPSSPTIGEDPQPDTTPATPLQPAAIPPGWTPASGNGFSFVVPPDWTVMPPNPSFQGGAVNEVRGAAMFITTEDPFPSTSEGATRFAEAMTGRQIQPGRVVSSIPTTLDGRPGFAITATRGGPRGIYVVRTFLIPSQPESYRLEFGYWAGTKIRQAELRAIAASIRPEAGTQVG